MNEPARAEFRISLEESLAFAALSGDFNPLHIDPVAARRTQFGDTVVHGIHAALCALDALAGTWLPPGCEPLTFGATFHNPVRTGAVIEVIATAVAMDGRVRLTAASDGKAAFTLNVAVASSSTSVAEPVAKPWPRRTPASLPFPPVIVEGETAIQLDRRLVAQLFPALHAIGRRSWIADLVTTTNIVGMECPGLDSIYSGFKLRRLDPSAAPAPVAMRFRLDRTDSRFRLARLAVRGSFFEGSLDTFFRPPAVAQRTLHSVAQEIPSGLFAHHRALVVGGSRGLGEIAAKVLIAGGAQVTISYARGRDDAASLQAEAEAAGATCTIVQLDASRPLSDSVRSNLPVERFSHVFYFASPHIDRNSSGHWDGALFDRFVSVYVHGFAAVVQAVVGSRRKGRDAPIQVLYPSSVFLDTDEPGFAEYCAAKAAGEMAGRHMTQAMPVEIHAPRLPRMRTDQTSALMGAGVADPFPVISELLRRYRA